eukprot:TRINITY_DN5310_c0_g3_i6.p1 TRINITY_DN5310_c0_g3~~TRINITY_DN5310_c0_g3_i6.p1  ORF type:complete len:120 (+),score=14.33 TRINITY_DN5310_c0_g3_i6:473-832(+)
MCQPHRAYQRFVQGSYFPHSTQQGPKGPKPVGVINRTVASEFKFCDGGGFQISLNSNSNSNRPTETPKAAKPRRRLSFVEGGGFIIRGFVSEDVAIKIVCSLTTQLHFMAGGGFSFERV